MSGNVWEWVQDWYMHSYSGLSIDNNPTDTGSKTRKVIRGGSCSDSPKNLRASSRAGKDPNGMSATVGFRLVISAKDAQLSKKEQPSGSDSKPYRTPTPPIREPLLYEPSSKPPPREDLKRGIVRCF
jgi:hypothetical protein